MLNQAAEMIHSKSGESNIETHKPHIKVAKASSIDSPNTRKKKSSKSPGLARRLLPNPPNLLKPSSSKNMSKSSDDLSDKKKDEEKMESTTSKYKYNSLPRKKKEGKSRTMSHSTFYVQDDDNQSKGNLSPILSKKESSSSESSLQAVVIKSRDKETKDKNTATSERQRKDSKDKNISNNEQQTHIALYKFYARHKDELSFLDGDPIQVVKMYDDLWYEGINLLTGKQGLFPCRYVADIMLHEIPSDTSIKDASDHRQFHMRFLGSVEVSDHKGDEILCFAIAKVVNQRSLLSTSSPPSCALQVNSRGIRICNLGQDKLVVYQDSDRKTKKGKAVDHVELDNENTHYFSLKNVTFCGNHPKDRRYFGFITKHPDEHRFACHILMSKYSTDDVAKTLGECFDAFYENYMEHRAPTEDIYIE